jgi:hypothetical protein
VFDAPKLSFYAATCYTWLGDTQRAEEHAREVIRQATAGGKLQWPTRLAVATLNLGLVAVRRGQFDQAAGLGLQALGAGRVVASTLPWFDDLDRALARRALGVAEARDFHEHLDAARGAQR